MLVSIALVASVCIGEYFAACEIAWIMAIGTLLEDATARKAHKGIEKLLKLKPAIARVKSNITEEIIPAEDVNIGDILVVLAGETIAEDGFILDGNTASGKSTVTGESIPVDKTVGDDVTSGTINQFGTFEMQVTKSSEDSSPQRMIRMAGEADANKAPCAFIQTTPTTVMAGIGNATKYCILARSGDVLQHFSKISHIAFDKTGTMAHGKPEVVGIESFDASISADHLLKLTALAEQRLEHPLGKSIFEYYLNHGGKTEETQDFNLIAEKGVSATVCGFDDRAGNSITWHKSMLLYRSSLNR